MAANGMNHWSGRNRPNSADSGKQPSETHGE